MKLKRWLGIVDNVQVDKVTLQFLAFLAYDYLSSLALCAQDFVHKKEAIHGADYSFPKLEASTMEQAVKILESRSLPP